MEQFDVILISVFDPWTSFIDNDVEYEPEELANLTSYCSQKDFPLLDNTIDENLKFFAQLTGGAGGLEDIRKKKRDVGLREEEGSILVSKLSADQKMMLNMAIVLLSNPEIIIMDEPTTGLLRKIFYLNKRKLKV